MIVPRVILCCAVLVTLEGGASGQSIRTLFKAGRDAVKHTINAGTTAVSNTLAMGNKAVQTGTSLVSSGIEKGSYAGRLVVGAGTAIAGHAMAVGSNKAVNATSKVDALLKDVPIVGSIVKAGHDKVRQTISSVNKVSQAALNGVDIVSDASLTLTNKANEIGAGIISNTAKITTGISQASVALGSSLVQTGVDNAFTFGRNVANQVTSGHFNVSALGNNITAPGSKWILNENSKAALSSLLPALNQTFSSHHH